MEVTTRIVGLGTEIIDEEGPSMLVVVVGRISCTSSNHNSRISKAAVETRLSVDGTTRASVIPIAGMIREYLMVPAR